MSQPATNSSVVSRSQPLDAPAGAAALIAQPIMQVIRAALPELDGVRSDDVPTPARRAADGAALSVDLPAVDTSVTVPSEFLEPGTDYKFEVLAVADNHNQTIHEGTFSTAG